MFEFLFDTNKIVLFFLTVVRISGILFTAPVFGSEIISARIKLFLSILIGILIFPFITAIDLSKANNLLMILIIIKELLIGIATGLIGRFLFVGVQFGGQVIGTQMGFGIVNVLDPQNNAQISLVAQFQNIIMILFFLVIGGHLYIIQAIVKSFEMIPLGVFVFNKESYIFIVTIFSKIFLTALKITAPIFVTLLVTQVVLGIMGRLVPQLNILIIGFPIQIAGGLIVIITSLTFFYSMFESLMYEYLNNILRLFRYLGV
ncbi:flagellar biosynthetic protein FliR [Calditerrivibrio nitroreducens]|uniref:Flagellar biosynthetic protein FliR n=1 Tax=Calditerrivibrio nitroreducens (strain DSM 19672 / NBRC 101217 / Yu37-1) TaxID=768670 RepID=E4TGJ0_CALNY|nr:flagellar biosynthetic protein FliR [Calditerrivibrio nitroreducens]ADR18671.1 flagellar biosynthetic protein FliR [Calditerrivibrio nitroreducens DSM 19672]